MYFQLEVHRLIYQWSNACADSSCLILESGEVSIVVTDANGCSNQIGCSVSAGIDDLEQVEYIIDGNVLKFSQFGDIQLFSMTGQIIKEVESNEMHLMQCGCYVVRFISGNGLTHHFVICHMP